MLLWHNLVNDCHVQNNHEGPSQFGSKGNKDNEIYGTIVSIIDILSLTIRPQFLYFGYYP